jgi:hypothetical protein
LAYLSLIRIPGDSDELLADDTMPSNMERLGPKHGLIANARCATDEGILVMNLWQSKEGSEDMAREADVQRGREQSDVPMDEVRFEHYEVGDYRVLGG